MPPPASLSVPGLEEIADFELPAELRRLREKARSCQRGPQGRCVELTYADAGSWAAHTDQEDWLVWRGRMTAERLRGMPLDTDPGETIVGRPVLRSPTDAEQEKLEQARRMLASMPPFPGGDAGHFHPDYDRLFDVGLGGMLQEIGERRAVASREKRPFFEACHIAMSGMADYVRRVAAACRDMGKTDRGHAKRWQSLAGMCERLATDPPRTFHEALQLMFMTQIALWFGSGQYLTSPGRMDRTLLRFYRADLAAGVLTRREALELLCCHFIQLNRILWPGTAISVLVGGRDAGGRDVTNDLTYLCLAARAATRLVYPTVGLAWHADTPDELMDFAVRLLGSGVGDPALFNDDLIANGLRNHGVSEADCRNYVNSTCVEIKVAGASNIWVTQPYFNCPAALLEVIARAARDPDNGPGEFDELLGRVREELAGKVAEAAERMDGVWQRRAEHGCFPLASCFVRDCLREGRDFDRGGARYNWVENSFVGLANLIDGLLAVKRLVYETGELSLAELHDILEADFEGNEALCGRIRNDLPKYGNDLEETDELAAEMAEFLIECTQAQRVGPHRYVPGFFCWIKHEQLGAETGATPDGRRAGRPLADSAGPAQGRATRGPTAAVLSTTRWNHGDVLGGLVNNIRFARSMFDAPSDRRAVRDVIETYLRRGGFEIQVNVVATEKLRDAQEHPEKHADLLVRVAGYSDYFVHLNRNLQDEIIQRNEFETE
ncbi:MAG: pyruvate formate lyase family protein [Candidatus Brocadiia bacterium]